jgi:APA family basic amino acid/polyamine antiporter
MSSEKTGEDLKRIVGVPGLAATVVNFSIGAGIYALPALIGIQLGITGALTGFLLCGLMFAAIMVCYVEIGSKIKTTGGSYAYVEAAFGPMAGFIVNWLFFFGWAILSDAAIMNIVADSTAVLFPVFSSPFMRIILFLFLTALMIIANVRSAKQSIRVVSWITIIKLVPLFAIILFGFFQVKTVNLHWNEFPTLKSFGASAIILFFSLAGFESALSVSGEIKNPSRTIPRAILAGGILVFLIYVIIQAITIGVLGDDLIKYKNAPLAAVAEQIIGPSGTMILLLAAMISGLGSINGDVFASSRLLYAGARDGLFPKFLSKVHPRFATPHLAIFTFADLIFILSVSGGFSQLAILASGALLLIYMAVILATIKVRTVVKTNEEKSFRMPGGITIPVIAIAAITWVLSNLSRNEILSILIFVAAVCALYMAMKKLKASPGEEKSDIPPA